MGLFSNLSRKKKYAESVVLIDIGTDSIAGAYARFAENETPTLLFARRLSIVIRENEQHERAILRAIDILGNELIREGAPILMRATGSGSADTILVSIDASWEEINLRTEKLERESSFIFTKSIVDTILKNTATAPHEKTIANESIIGTMVNGYETLNPYGEEIHRASFTVFSSFIDKNISESIISALRGLFHTEHILLIAGRSLRSQAMRAAFPHEHDALLLDVIGPMASITLIRKNLFAAIAGEFAGLEEHYPLPRVIFLLAHESEISSRQRTLAAMPSEKLWLSEHPPKIVPVLASHVAGLVRQTTTAPPDLQLLLMALYYQHHSSEKKMI
jgi:hypothetical protein